MAWLHALVLLSLAQPSPRALERQIAVANRDLGCATDADCVVLPMGHKPCGGPRTWLVSTRANEPRVAGLLRALVRAEDAETARLGLLSSCLGPARPYGRCLGRTCTPTTPRPIPYRISPLPAVFTLDEFTRIRSQEALAHLWASRPARYELELPVLDFSTLELVPYSWCRTRGDHLRWLRLLQVEDVGDFVRAEYSEQDTCRSMPPAACLAQLASIPPSTKPVVPTFHPSTQACGAAGAQ